MKSQRTSRPESVCLKVSFECRAKFEHPFERLLKTCFFTSSHLFSFFRHLCVSCTQQLRSTIRRKMPSGPVEDPRMAVVSDIMSNCQSSFSFNFGPEGITLSSTQTRRPPNAMNFVRQLEVLQKSGEESDFSAIRLNLIYT